MLLISESIKDKVNIDDMIGDDSKADSDSVYIDFDPTAPYSVQLTFKSGQIVMGSVVELERTAPSNLDSSFENFKIVFSASPQMTSVFICDDQLESLHVTIENNLIMEKKINITESVSRNIKIHSQLDTFCQLIVKQGS